MNLYFGLHPCMPLLLRVIHEALHRARRGLGCFRRREVLVFHQEEGMLCQPGFLPLISDWFISAMQGALWAHRRHPCRDEGQWMHAKHLDEVGPCAGDWWARLDEEVGKSSRGGLRSARKNGDRHAGRSRFSGIQSSNFHSNCLWICRFSSEHFFEQ